MLKRFLVPLDGTPHAENALRCAAALAARTGAHITLLHVVEASAPTTVHGERHLAKPCDAMDYLASAAARHLPPGVPFDTHVHPEPSPHVAASIAAHDVEFRCDLIVISPHGPWNWKTWISGSVPQRVAKKIDTPVLVVRDFPESSGRPLFGSILIPDDASEIHEGAWEICFDFSKACHSDVRLLCVVETPQTLGGPGAATATFLPKATGLVLALAEETARAHIDAHLRLFAERGIAASGEVRRGDPFATLCDVSRKNQSDLVVLRSHRRAGLTAWIEGSLTSRFLAETGSSVLILPTSGQSHLSPPVGTAPAIPQRSS